jgi:P4 family phage/plasmid primase-like protien
MTIISVNPEYVLPEQFGNDFEGLSLEPPDYSDLGQAKVLVKECGDELCFTEATDFLRYDGKRWVESKQLALGCLEEFLDLQLADAEDQLDSARQELIRLGEPEDEIVPGKRYLDKLKASQNDRLIAAGKRFAAALKYREFVMQRRDMRYIKSALDAAKPMVRLDISELDSDAYLLNTPEATYDLRKGIQGAQAQEPLDHITKMTAVSPGEQGRKEWEDALQVFFSGNEELIRYVQQVVGMAAIGKIYMEAIVIAYGSGKNGKSTFWNTIARVFGSYAGNLSADTLTVGCKRNVKPEMAELKGKRLVIASELEEGMRLNTAMIKQLCSTDPIYAEKKYRDPFSFTPSHTLVLYTNHLPRVGASDDGTWRRLIVIPFDARIEAKQDVKNYADYLYRMSAPYILRWILEGAEEVIRNQYCIRLPGCVRRAIQNYRDNNDWFANFLDDCCDVNPAYSQKSGELYIEYRTYCARNGEYTRSTTDFYTALELAGFTKAKTNKGAFINGLRLKDTSFESI